MLPVSSYPNYSRDSYNSFSQPYWQAIPDAGYYTQDDYAPPQSSDNPVKTLTLAGLLQVMTLGLDKVSRFLSNRLSAGKEFTTADNVQKVAASMVKNNGLDITVGYVNHSNKNAYSAAYGMAQEFETVANAKNAFHCEPLKLAVAPSSKPSLILHELGHAINAKGTFTKMLQQSRRYAAYAPTALLLANGLFKDKNNGQKTFIERNAGVLGFVAFLPTIIEEGLASFRGIKAAKHVLKNPPKLNILKKNYAIALGTYIIAGLGLGIASKQTVLEDSVR